MEDLHEKEGFCSTLRSVIKFQQNGRRNEKVS